MKESEQLLAQGLPVLTNVSKPKASIQSRPYQRRQREDSLVLAVKPQLEDPTGGHLLGRSEISDRLCESTVR
jgi:hypothetical protein